MIYLLDRIKKLTKKQVFCVCLCTIALGIIGIIVYTKNKQKKSETNQINITDRQKPEFDSEQLEGSFYFGVSGDQNIIARELCYCISKGSIDITQFLHYFYNNEEMEKGQEKEEKIKLEHQQKAIDKWNKALRAKKVSYIWDDTLEYDTNTLLALKTELKDRIWVCGLNADVNTIKNDPEIHRLNVDKIVGVHVSKAGIRFDIEKDYYNDVLKNLDDSV